MSPYRPMAAANTPMTATPALTTASTPFVADAKPNPVAASANAEPMAIPATERASARLSGSGDEVGGPADGAGGRVNTLMRSPPTRTSSFG
jgi:hypothetical protein